MRWQVSWLAGQCSLPPSRPVAWGQISVALGKRSPLTVAGAAVGLYPIASRRRMRTTFPHRSLVRERPSKGGSTTLRPHIVNGNPAPGAVKRLRAGPRRTIVVADRMHYPARVVRCSDPAAWGWRVKRESGASARLAFNSGTAPATVSESRRISWSLRRWRGKAFRRPKAFASPETGLASSSG
jgi:hypothetical protein